MGSRVAAVVLLGLAARAGAQTVPLQTEEARTAKAGTLVFETGAEAIAAEPSYLTGSERTRWDGPLLRWVYSPADNVELDLEWVVRVGAAAEPALDAVSDAGDVSLRAKWRCYEAESGRSTLTARFGVTLPETSYEDESGKALGLGPNTLRAYVQGLFTVRVAKASLHANAGLLIFDEVYRPHDQRDLLLYGLALTQPLGPRFEVLAEIAGRAGDGAPGAEQRSEARVGLRFGRGRVRGHLALRRGLLPADGTWGGAVGLSWVVKPGRPAPPVP
jgi:hypothetical protein